MKDHFAAAGLALVLAACSNEPQPTANSVFVNDVNARAVSAPTAPSAPAENTAVTEPIKVSRATVLALEGFAELAIGQPIPSKSTWAERGAQASRACRTVTSPDYPGVYAIVEGGKVRRITAGQRSTVKLAEGIGVGSAETEVKKWFPSFRVEPHEYQAAPAKYLTAPNAPSGDSALRLEIGEDGKVGLIHVGTMPVLGYVEGCV